MENYSSHSLIIPRYFFCIYPHSRVFPLADWHVMEFPSLLVKALVSSFCAFYSHQSELLVVVSGHILTLMLVWNNSLGESQWGTFKFPVRGSPAGCYFPFQFWCRSPSSLLVFVSTSLWSLVSLCRYPCWRSGVEHHIRNTTSLNTTMALFAKTVTVDFFFPRSLCHSPDCSISSSEGHIYKTCYSDSLSWTVLHNYFSVSHGIILPKPLCIFSYAFAGFDGYSTNQQGRKYWTGIKAQSPLLQRVTQATLYNLDAR